MTNVLILTRIMLWAYVLCIHMYPVKHSSSCGNYWTFQALDCWLDIPKDRMTAIAGMTDMLQTASLMIDDIEDNSELRRGIPAAHTVYGVPNTINSANYVYFLALQQALTWGHPHVASVFTGRHTKP